ncbi:hypothetical protein Taro_021991 [Colocasia esculenta]|uniref:Uncharacterized protein n=1 Tax=Colocasia esculenta TaxID=4460 RepID=A0A843V0A8_COLES|nr:hypothetical protein [Colocasia esculenta]
MGVRSTVVLRRLKQAIEKVKFLLSTNLSQWLYIGSAASASRRLSFRDQPGLLDIVSDAGSEAAYEDAAASSLGPSRAVSPAPGILSRTISSLWAEIPGSPSMARSASSASSSGAADAAVDVDSRADAFIANFWRHIQIERQVSLELRRAFSFVKEGSLSFFESTYGHKSLL